MSELPQYLLVVVAIAVGWAMGRWGQRQKVAASAAAKDAAVEYYQGLSFLLNDQPDAAIDSFINALEVNTDTLETHLAVGTLLRKRGEVERAIRVHQNLLARPSLSPEHLHQVHLELARDYIAAGLLDRAERILQDLLGQAPELRETALRYLLEIYQDEREWDRAIAVARELVPRKPWLRSASAMEASVNRNIAHFYCEQAEASIRDRDFPLARSALQHAINADKNCVRASILMGRLELEAGEPRQAIRAFRRVFQQNPGYMGEVLELLRRAHESLDTGADYASYLMSCYEQYPSTAILLALVDSVASSNGTEQAASYLAEQLRDRPTLRGLSQLISLRSAAAEDETDEYLGAIQDMLGHLLSSKPVYQCSHCGFSGRNLHWQCPSCKQWGSITPIRGAEGD